MLKTMHLIFILVALSSSLKASNYQVSSVDKVWEYQDSGKWGLFGFFPAKYRSIHIKNISSSHVEFQTYSKKRITLSISTGKIEPYLFNTKPEIKEEFFITSEWKLNVGTTIKSLSRTNPWTLFFKNELWHIEAKNKNYILLLDSSKHNLICLDKLTGKTKWRIKIFFDKRHGRYGEIMFYQNIPLAYGINISTQSNKRTPFEKLTLVFFNISDGSEINTISLPGDGVDYYSNRIIPVSNGFLIKSKDGKLNYFKTQIITKK